MTAKQTTYVILITLGMACVIYLLSSIPWIDADAEDAFRKQVMYFTGTCAMMFMTLSTIISVRIPCVNRIFSGLDKAYVVHKWSGVFALAFIIIHGFGGNIIPSTPQTLESSLPTWIIKIGEAGLFMAERTFALFILLIVLALFKRIPYHIFRKTHKIIPAIYLILVFHAVGSLLKGHWQNSFGGWLLILFLCAGTIAAFIALIQQIGRSRQFDGTIEQIDLHDTGILDISVGTPEFFKHRPGQFAFLRFAHSSEPHPFTVASYSDTGHHIRFAIKGLGNFTSELKDRIHMGQKVRVEGPYGEFTFDDRCKRQLWIAGGVGITPFLARLDYLNLHGKREQDIDFWYCTRGELDIQFPEALTQRCLVCGVRLHHIDATKNQLLTLETLRSISPELGEASIWFCGPELFRVSLHKELGEGGFDQSRFHFEEFKIR